MDIVSNYVNHSLNKSKAKAAFSFPRSSRLQQSRKDINCSFYELPSVKSRRACSFGLGNKISLAQNTKSPPPNAYRLKSQFTQRQSAISFGQSRDVVKFGSFLQGVNISTKLPAPNSYRTKLDTFSKKGGRMALRLPTQLDRINKQKTPGPGAYEPKHLNLSDIGQYFISKFKNQCSPRYQNPQNQLKNVKQRLSTVGPCTYEITSKQIGKSILSKFRNSVIGTIPKSERKGLIDKQKLKIPGFKYRSFSQFGQPNKVK